jgi:hypothetical protein
MTTDVTEAQRILNAGRQETLKKLGVVTFKELTLEQLIQCATELATIVTELDFSGDSKQFLPKMLQSPAALSAVRTFAAMSCNHVPEDFEGMGVSDWAKTVAAIKAVNDWEELSKVFTELGVTQYFAARMQRKPA